MKAYLQFLALFLWCSALEGQTCAFNIGNDTALCTPFNFTIHGPNNFASYTWSPSGANTQNITVSSPGTYSVAATITSPNLVINGNFNQGNFGFTSNYLVPASPGPWGLLSNAGTYQTTTSPNLVHNNFLSFGDHTTGTGTMMVCNGSAVANAVVWSQTISILPNVNYNFSAWVASVYNTITPNVAMLQFSINNVLIGPTFPAPLTGGVWSNFNVNWNSAANTSAIIKIVDQNITAPHANDFAIDDISFKTTCTYTDAITIHPLTNLPISATVSGSLTCQQNSVSIIGTTTLSGTAQTCTWSGPGIISGANTLTVGVNQPGIYTLTVSQGVCASTTTVAVQQNTIAPSISATVSNSLTCQLLAANLLGSSTTSGITYTWLPQNVNTASLSVNSPGSYSLVAFNPINGCTNNTVVAVSQNTTAPNISAVVSNSLNCQLLTANLTGSSTTTGVTYNWLPQNTSSSLVTVSNPGSFSLTLVNPTNGCSSNTVVTVTQNTTVPNISAIVSNSLNCLQQTANLIGNSTTSGVSYSWSPLNITTATAIINSPSSYSLIVFNPFNGCSSNTVVTVNQNTTAPSANINVSNIITCQQPNAVLTASSTCTNPVFSWLPQNITASSISVSSPGSYSIVVLDPANNCTNTTVASVQSTANFTANIAVLSQINCFGNNNGALQISNASGISPFTITNLNNSNTVFNIPALPFSFTNLSAANYSLIITDSNGCSQTLYASITQPPALITSISGATNVCEGQSTAINAFVNGGTAPYNYAWSHNGGIGPALNAAPVVSTIYSITVTDNNGCMSVAQIELTVNPKPNATLVNTQIVGCAPVCATFSLTVPPASGYIFNWSFSSSALTNAITSSNVNPDLCFLEPGIYNADINIINSHGCIANLNFPSLIEVYKKPVADFSFAPQNPTVLEPTLIFTNLSTGASNYKWYNLNQQFSTQINPVQNFYDPGLYYITLIASNQFCADTLTKQIKVEDESSIYIPSSFTPNGDNVNDTFFPVISYYTGKDYSLLIFNRWGELIFASNNFSETEWDGSYKGKLCKQDQYVYKLSLTNYKGKAIQKTGHVTLIK